MSVKEEYEGELGRIKEENKRRQLLHVVFKELRVVLNRADVSDEYIHPEQEPEHIYIKAEEEPEPNIKEEEEPKPAHVNEDPEALQIKEEEEPQTSHIKDEETPLHLKEEEQEVNITHIIVKSDDGDKEEGDGDHSVSWAPGATTANVKRTASNNSGTAKKRQAISVETKVAIIKMLDSGKKVANVSRLYKRNPSTISTIYKNKDRIMAHLKSSESVQEKLIVEMEKLLSAWIEQQKQRRAPLRLKIIKEKAKSIFEDLKVKAGEDAIHETFSTSCGWFDRFKKSANLHRRLSVRGKAAIAHKNTAEKLPDTFPEMNVNQGDAPQKSCNVAQNKWNCSQCDTTFVNKYALKKHMILHTGEKRFICSDCGKSFTWKVHLKTHTRTHTGEKPFACSVCGKKFAQKGHVRTHMKIHTGERPFPCSVCNFSFCQRSGLTKHMKTHIGEKHFSCSICEKKFLHSWALKKHARIHSGEKPYACSVCDKRFSAKTNLTRHIKTHSGVKLLTCKVCGKTFSKKTNLIMHSRTHTGEKKLPTLFWVPILFPSTQTQ